MSIVPLPQFEADLKAAEEDRLAYEKLQAPDSIVVRFGAMRLIGEFAYDQGIKLGCGSKVVVRTQRGVELGEMLTTTCPNAGCGSSVSRSDMLQYIENSGGRDYPFFEDGKVLRIASASDLSEQAQLDAQKPAMVRTAREKARELGLEMKIVDAEPILGGNRLTFFFTAEHRVDFRELIRVLAREFATRIEMRQIGARDEARLTADYERCGQHCCCKQFLKVLKPISMKSAKIQKATLDPLKISGRCGRLMCCLRYEDETYAELYKRLPKIRKRVGTPDGAGMVVDRQILTQLVLVRLEDTNKQIAVAVEDLCDPDNIPPKKAPDPTRGMSEAETERRSSGRGRNRKQDSFRDRSKRDEKSDATGAKPKEDAKRAEGESDSPTKRKRRRGRRGGRGGRGTKDGKGGQSQRDPQASQQPKQQKDRSGEQRQPPRQQSNQGSSSERSRRHKGRRGGGSPYGGRRGDRSS